MILRRGGAAKRSTTECSELFSSHLPHSASSQQLESVEVESGSITATTTLKHDKSHTTNGIHPINGIIEGSPRQQHHRRIGRQQQGFLPVLLRLSSHVRRKPHLAKELLICVTATFLLLFWISLVVAAVMHRNMENQSKASAPFFQAKPQHQIHLMVSEPPTQHELATSQKRKLETGETTKHSSFKTTKSSELMPQFDVIFRKKANSVDHSGLAGTDQLDQTDVLDGREADYGDLEMYFFEENGAMRQIFHDYEAYHTDYRPPTSDRDDDLEMYYAFDDDYERSHYTAYTDEGKIDDSKRCRRITDHRLSLQNCNNVHEVGLLEYHAKYLSAGAYRQVFVVDYDVLGSSEKIIIKDLHYSSDVKYENFEFVRMDAIVAERLTASPRVFDIYGFCGLSILSEFFPHGDIELAVVPEENEYHSNEDMHDMGVKHQNNFTAIEKLRIGAQMAEALVDLHGYRNGVIVHGDIQLSQYLYNADKSLLKINDFNRAEFMLWDDKNEKYCTYRNGHGHGNWRSPEEYYDSPLTEQLDVWSLGNNLYSLLTGVWPFFDEDETKMQVRVKGGETAYIDPQYRTGSLAEGALVGVIEMCFKYKPEDRPSIFEVASLLQEALARAEAADEAGKASS